MKRRGGGRDNASERMLEADEASSGQGQGRGSEKRQRFEWRLVKYEALPEYLKDNEFIRDYYRSEWPLKAALLSVFSWHNETLNVWTHLGGFILFVVLTVLSSMEIPEVREMVLGFSRSFPVRKNMSESFWTPDLLTTQISQDQTNDILEPMSRVPRWPWFIFLSGAMVCLACSSISHLLSCHSRQLNLFFWRLDYSGISLMIVSSFVPPIYYAFLCHPLSRLFYLTTIALLGLGVILTLLSPVFSSPRFRPLRASLFLAMGFSGVVPATHALIINWDQPSCHVAVAYEALMGLAYGTGAAFYVTRVPERWKPGAFDLAGHSHQIFHLFVIAGALAHYTATRVLMDWRESGATCQVPDALRWQS